MEAGVNSARASQKSSTAFVTPSLSALHSLIDIELMKRSSRHDILRLTIQGMALPFPTDRKHLVKLQPLSQIERSNREPFVKIRALLVHIGAEKSFFLAKPL